MYQKLLLATVYCHHSFINISLFGNSGHLPQVPLTRKKSNQIWRFILTAYSDNSLYCDSQPTTFICVRFMCQLYVAFPSVTTQINFFWSQGFFFQKTFLPQIINSSVIYSSIGHLGQPAKGRSSWNIYIHMSKGCWSS